MAHYIIELPDETPEQELVKALENLATSVLWVAARPDGMYDNEWGFTDENSWDAISESVQKILGDCLEDHEPDWPPMPYCRWTVQQRRQLIHLAVARWDYLGPNGIESQCLMRDYRSGRLDVFKPAA